MKQINYKKLILPNIPYVFFVYLFDKVGQAVRLSPGADLSGKLLSIGDGFTAAFSNALPSIHPLDLLIGIAGAAIIRLAVYVKGKNAKKYRKGMEYGSARWGNSADIAPYIDPVFANNVLLTQTERLMMSSRPKQPKYARNKNVLVIGGSGSGKTTLLYQRIRARAEAGEKSILLVPEQFTSSTEGRIHREMGDALSGLVESFSFTSLAEHILSAEGGSAVQTLSDAGRAVLVRRALEELQDNVHYYYLSLIHI